MWWSMGPESWPFSRLGWMVCWGGVVPQVKDPRTQGPKDGLVEDGKRRGGPLAESLRSTRPGFNVQCGLPEEG